MSDAPTPELFESERREVSRLHYNSWKSIHRVKDVTYGPNVSAQTYHPAYMASRIQQLENMVGSLTALLLQKYPTMQKELFKLLGEVYAAQIKDLELHTVVHNVAYHLYPRKSDEVVRQEED